MSSEHPYDRYDRAKKAVESQEAKVEELIQSLHDSSSRLSKHWRDVQFSGYLSNGNSVYSETQQGHLVVDMNAPSIETIYQAIIEWKKAEAERRGSINDLNPDQRKTLGL